jgi:predicted ester cyclase
MATNKAGRIRSANEELIGIGRLDIVGEFFAADYVVHFDGKEFRGPAFVKRFIKDLRKAIPDVRVVDVKVLMQAGDTIAWQRTLRGTHAAELKRIPPSGKKVQWNDMLVSRFDGEQIAEEWSVSDLAAQLMFKLPRSSSASG